MCNIWLKFGKLWAYGKQVGADYVATGHYARIARAGDGTLRVARARPGQGPVVRPVRASARTAAARALPGGDIPSRRSGGSPASTICPCTTSRTARKSASFPMTITWDSCVSAVPR